MSKATDRLGDLEELRKVIGKLQVIKAEAKLDYDITVMKFRELHEQHLLQGTQESLAAVLVQCDVCEDADFFLTDICTKAIESATEEYAGLITAIINMEDK